MDPGLLLLETVNRHFQGSYSCSATTRAGRATASSNTVTLRVTYPPGRMGTVRSMYVLYNDNTGGASITWPGSRSVYRGEVVELGCQVASPGSDPANTRYSWWLQGEHLDQEEGPSLSLDTAPGHHLGQEVQVTCAGGNTAGWGEAGHLNLTLLTGPTLTRALQPATPVLRSQVPTLTNYW